MGIVDEFRLLVLVATHRVVAAREEGGQAMVEYALIVAFVAILAVAGLAAIGTDVGSLLSRVAAGFP
jgi:Flp pilus assembly pilin Flp